MLRSARSAAMPYDVEISVVIPCLDEEMAVGNVVDHALEGISRSGRTGEVIVADNGSNDRPAEIAAAGGQYVVMGDADETYPLRELGPFLDRLEHGDDLVLGSRFRGTIHGGA